MLRLVHTGVHSLAGFALLALVGIMAAACAGGVPSPDGSFFPTPDDGAAPTAAPAANVYLGPPPAQAPIPIREPSYLTEVIPPCTPLEGVADNPCGQPAPTNSRSAAAATSVYLGEEPFDYPYFLDPLGGSLPNWTPHLVVRATTIPSTFRCDLGPPHRFHGYMDIESTHHRIGDANMYCYIDARANEYIIGAGPPTLTLIVDYDYYSDNHSAEDVEQIRSNMERTYIEGGELVRRGGFIDLEPLAPSEAVFFIGPSRNAAQEVWEVIHQWRVNRPSNGNVYVIHPNAGDWYTLDEAVFDPYLASRIAPSPEVFRTNLRAAYQARMEETGGRILPATETEYLGAAQWPMLITDANRLQQYGIDVGNYDHPDGPPERPPAPCGMGAVDNQVDNYGLMQDCSALLDAKGDLDGSLNWAVDRAMSGWDGVTLASGRVVTVDLEDESLTGTVSRHLGRLTALETLKLANTSLTGHIPASLADLDLDELKLAGNSLVGCIPAGLRDIDSHDLGSLGLADCQAPPPDADSSLEFTSTAYQFSIAEDAAVGAAVGAVQASDTNPTRTLTYTITAGNAAGKFAIAGHTRAITVAAQLDYETRQQYTLTVNVNNGAGGNKTTTMTVSVTDVVEDPPTPQNPT